MLRQGTGTIRNPVLPGSHPDPSVLRVGADYYLATSTFEWYPGVRLHHSRDLVHWQPLGGALDSTRLLDLTGCPDSGGVWAPNLSYADGLFHLVYSNVSTYAAGFTDSPNRLVTAPTIHGPWSDPVPLHSRGFDASLFHDGDDSRLLNLVHDWRPGHGGSAGLEATRYDRAARRLVGDPERIALPPGSGWIEGPNLYRRGPWYYLFTADGGTGYQHQVTVARAASLTGPYERDPHGPLLTARDHPDLPLQKAGHGSLVHTPGPDGRTYLAYLVGRPHGRHGPCILGRETALAHLTWSPDGWPRTGTGLPTLDVPAPAPASAADGLYADDTQTGEPQTGDPYTGDPYTAAPYTAGPHTHSSSREVDGFDAPTLGPDWSTLRRPAAADWLSLTERRSHLRIRGGPLAAEPDRPQPGRPSRRRAALPVRGHGGLPAAQLPATRRHHRLLQHPQLVLPARHRGRRRPAGPAPGRLRPRRDHRGRGRSGVPRRRPVRGAAAARAGPGRGGAALPP
jgi:xylan 1,4-beta-xylosidase